MQPKPWGSSAGQRHIFRSSKRQQPDAARTGQQQPGGLPPSNITRTFRGGQNATATPLDDGEFLQAGGNLGSGDGSDGDSESEDVGGEQPEAKRRRARRSRMEDNRRKHEAWIKSMLSLADQIRERYGLEL